MVASLQFPPALVRGRAGSLILTCLLTLGCLPATRAQLPGTVDPAFAPTVRSAGSIVSIVTQPDGKQIIGGNFSYVGPLTAPSLARLNADGSFDPSFTPPAGLGPLDYVALGADGKVFVLSEVIVGYSIGYEISRLNADGSLDSAFTPITFAGDFISDELYPFILAPQADGRLLVAGDFSTDPTSTAATYDVRRYNTDGSRDTAFQLPSTISAFIIDSVLALSNGQVLVSGSFSTRSSNSTPPYGLIRLNPDGSLDSSYPADPTQFGPGFDLTLQPDGKLLYLKDSGSYGLVGGVPQRLNPDGTVDTSFAPQFGTGAAFSSLALQPDGKVVVGGYTAIIPSPAGGTPTLQSGVVRVNADGTADTTFNPVTPLADNLVTALALQADGQIIVGGTFQTLANALSPGLGRLHPDGSTDATFSSTVTKVGDAFAVTVQANGQPLIADSGEIIDGALASSLISFNANGSLNTIFAGDLASGQAYSVGAAMVPTNPVLAVQPDGKVLLTGTYQPFASTYDTDVKRFNVDGSLDTGFQPFLNETYAVFKAVAPLADGRLYFAGELADGYNEGNYPINRLNADGSLDNTFMPATDPGASVYQGSTIYSLAVQPDGKVLAAGGFLNPYGGPAQASVLRFNPNGSLDLSFNAGVFTNPAPASSGSAAVLALQPDGKVIVSGSFTEIGSVPANNLARLNPDGSVDPAFNAGSGPVGSVNSIALQPNGEILLGGGFTSVNGVSLNGVARLKADGTVDPLFFPGTGAGGKGVVNSLALAPDGSLLVGGTFTTFDGQVRDGVARLAGGDVVAPSITAASTAAAQVGQAFSYQIAASNNPTSYGATGLPAGLSVAPATGVISGTPTAAGTFSVTLSATNVAGTGTAMISLVVAPVLPVATLVATTPTVTVGSSQAGVFTLSLSSPPGSDVMVNLSIKGTAVNGTDYVLLKMTKKIKAGHTTKPIKILPQGDLGGASKKTVKLTLEPGSGYTVGTTGKVKVSILASPADF